VIAVPAIRVDAALAGIVRLGLLAIDAVHVADRDTGMDGPLADAEARLRLAPDRPAVVTAVRTMYKRVGIDPTKTRPSSEALLRRVRKGLPLPRVNSAVDVCNWCSVETQLPYGLYDLDRIDGGVVLRLGTAGEEYGGIRKDVVHLEGRLTLADARGPFGNPTSDSARTMVTTHTTRLLFAIFVPGELPARAATEALALTAERAGRFVAGTEILREVRP
jgi:DNA/RNA-binding domain of Phe-tRNA-synthetase-like protein